MAGLVRILLWFLALCLFALSIAVLTLHSIVRGDSAGDPRIDHTVTGFGIVAGILGIFASLASLVVLATKNLHRRFLNVLHLWFLAWVILFLAAATGMWILYMNVGHHVLKNIDKASFAIDLFTLLVWMALLPLWAWKTMEEYALGHK